ncbi:tRNA epoxyqueuosine(34) reductase QueG [Bdellovibrionota bacterium FG-2]
MPLHDLLTRLSLEEGFSAAGGVDLDQAPSFKEHLARFDSWLEQGHADEMHYLVRGRDRRAEPRAAFPVAQSVFCVAMSYSAKPLGAPNEGPRFARYMRGGDYHEEMAKILERVLEKARHTGRLSGVLKWKTCIDTGAVLERSWATISGLGWIGKNSMLLNREIGSYFLIGVVFLNQKLGQKERPQVSLCGHCTRCLEACPTQAFTESGMLDSRRCISGQTLEKRGEHTSLTRSSQGWVAGCDICQEVCPFNQKKAKRDLGVEFEEGDDFILPLDWDALGALTETEYKERVKHSSLNRVKWPEFQRNLRNAK